MPKIFQTSEQRKVRVFVSSTFSDLSLERDYLVRIIFPRIRKFCLEKDIEFIEIDLRWGITEEEAQQGKVISICLKEIEQSRPYFIGILKDRYGWVPDESLLTTYSGLSEEFPWIEKDISDKLSITEMEIQFGVLRNPAYQNQKSPKAFFFIKKSDPSSVKKNDEETLKLNRLKEMLIDQSVFPVNIFDNAKELGESVYQQLTGSIRNIFEEVKTTALEKIRNEHIEFARNRLRIYIKDEQLYSLLDRHVESTDPPLLVTGVSGMGKTALIANWLNHYNTLHPDDFIFFHFTGSSADSTSHLNLVRRLMEEIKLEYQIADNIPVKPDEMLKALPMFLAATSVAGKKCIIILDALNQLENENNALLMNWFPEFIPDHIRLIVSALPGVTCDAFMTRQYKLFEVPELNVSYRKKLISGYLSLFGKKLTPNQVERIAVTSHFGNPLLLTSFLEELRIFGSFEKLDAYINSFLALSDNESYFEQILARIEADFTFSTKVSAGKVLSLIWRSRKGLAEREIMATAGIRPLDWSQLLLATGFHLINKGGYINFGHNFFRNAVERRYLADENSKNQIARELISYFEAEHLSMRSMQELPYLYSSMQDWGKLSDYITDPDIFLMLFSADEVEFKRICIPVREREEFSKSFYQRWKKSKHHRNDYFGSGMKTANILNELGFYAEALKILRKLLNASYKIFNNEEREEILFQLGSIYRLQGDYKNSIKYLSECYKIRKEKHGEHSLKTADVQSILGYTYEWMGKYTLAESLYKKAHKTWLKHKLHNSPQLASSYNYLGLINYETGNYKQSLINYKKHIEIARKLYGNDHPELSDGYNNIGLVYLDTGKHKLAKENLLNSLRINLNTIGPNHPRTSTDYNNIGEYFKKMGDIVTAKTYFQKALDICYQVFGRENMETSTVETNMGDIHEKLMEHDKALEFYQNNLNTCIKEAGMDSTETGNGYIWVGAMLCELGELKESENNLLKGIKIIEKNLKKSDPSIGNAMLYLGRFYLCTQQFEDALNCFKRSQTIYIKSHGVKTLEYSLALDKFGELYSKMQDFESAVDCLTKSLAIKAKIFHKHHYEVANTLSLIGDMYAKQNFMKDAQQSYTESLEIFKNQQFEKRAAETDEKISKLNLMENQ